MGIRQFDRSAVHCAAPKTHLNTFSVAGRCPRSGMLGVAVSSAVPAAGALCIYVKAGVAAISTQAWVNPYLAIDTLTAIERGFTAADALIAALRNDPSCAERQIGVVDSTGQSAAYSGTACTPSFGSRNGHDYSIQGNMLPTEDVLDAMEDSFAEGVNLPLAERLLTVLEAGEAAGGDKRGKQSAALKVAAGEVYPWIDIRVDEHAEPIAELRRIYKIHELQTRPFLDGMAKRGKPATPMPESVQAMLLRAPPDRPGGGGSG